MSFKVSLISIILAAAVTANAKIVSGTRIFEIKNAKLNTSHLPKDIITGSVSVDYDNRLVTMKLQPAMPHCPTGMACIQVMPQEKVISLPLTSVTTTHCGILEVEAFEDLRPVDGILRKLNFIDATKTTCMFFAPVIQQASYETRGYDRLKGAEFHFTSTMELILKQVLTTQQTRQFQFAEGTLNTGFPSREVLTAGELTLNEKNVHLNVSVGLDCKPQEPCPKYMPAPIQVDAKIFKIEKSSCGDRITAAAEIKTPYGRYLKTAVITDFSSALCEMYIPHIIQAEYTEKHLDLKGKTLSVKKASMSFDSTK